MSDRVVCCRACPHHTPSAWGHHVCAAIDPPPTSRGDAIRRRVFVFLLWRDPYRACPLGKWSAERERPKPPAPPTPEQMTEDAEVYSHNLAVCRACENYQPAQAGGIHETCMELEGATTGCRSKWVRVLASGVGCPIPEQAQKMKAPGAIDES